ncbi:MAG: ORC1-type DNA replication protein [Candidatus Aenigmarchaeota archaeon]|nr:ORC1-type DNA replication protein [Candidatus Aenigmarchaeota archaeon]
MGQLSLKEMFSTYKEGNGIFKNKDILTSRYIPQTIAHREDQINQIAKTLAPSLRGEKVSNLFVFGTVGTGKTVSTNTVVKELEKTSKKIKILYMNCKMKNVSDTEYRLLAELSRMMGEDIPYTGLPTDRVYQIFFEKIDSLGNSVILVLDEIDALVKKIGDGLLYNLTRINENLKKSKLSIVGISNDISFTETIDPRVKSSLSEEEIVFPPYNATQLKDILTQRAGMAFSDGIIEPGVIQKCAALAAQEHGDARRALDLLRMAGEIVERAGEKNIKTEHIDKAEEKLDFDRLIEVVRSQPKQSLAVLSSVIRLTEDGHKNIQTGDVFYVYEKICSSRGLKLLTQRRVSDLIAELDMMGVINTRVISKGRYGRTREIRMLLGENLLSKVKKILTENDLLPN